MNGVKGMKFTSYKNGGSIFLPAAGYRADANIYYAGEKGFYWSSYLRKTLRFSDNCWIYDSEDREKGLTVRPVTKLK